MRGRREGKESVHIKILIVRLSRSMALWFRNEFQLEEIYGRFVFFFFFSQRYHSAARSKCYLRSTRARALWPRLSPSLKSSSEQVNANVKNSSDAGCVPDRDIPLDSPWLNIKRRERCRGRKNNEKIHRFIAPLSVRANRNDTYFSLSLSRVRSPRFLHAYFAFAFYEVTTTRANIEKRAQPVKRRVNKARKITTDGLNTYTDQHRFLLPEPLPRRVVVLSLSLNYLWTINNLPHSTLLL